MKKKMSEEVGPGILIGMGMMFVMLGFFGWLHTNYLIEKLSYVFGFVGIDASRHYLINSLSKLMQIYMGFIVTGFVLLFFGSLGIKKKVKSDTINLGILLVLGSTLAFLGLINWVEASFYIIGLMFILISPSYTKYRAYARYYVPMLLVVGATTAILGWYLIPTLQQIPPPANPYVSSRIFVVTTGMGVFCGGIVNFVVRNARRKRRNQN